MIVEFVEWKPMVKNTLRGFASIKIPQIGLIIKDVTIHEENGKRWAGLPARPMINKAGQAMTDESGKIQYQQLLNFGSRSAADAFSKAVIDAFEQYEPTAFESDPIGF
jgi:hypothetical protein